jgi:hypothetical protein
VLTGFGAKRMTRTDQEGEAGMSAIRNADRPLWVSPLAAALHAGKGFGGEDMAKTREIPRDEWPGFLDAFSRVHGGAPVRTEIFDSDFGAQEETEHLRLSGITADLRDAGGERITIALGRSPDDHLSHSVARPTKIRVLQSDAGRDEALEIESADGAPVLLRILSTDADRRDSSVDHELESARPNRR